VRDVERVREGRGERPGVPRPQLARAQVEAVEPRLFDRRWRRFSPGDAAPRDGRRRRRRVQGPVEQGVEGPPAPQARAALEQERRRVVRAVAREERVDGDLVWDVPRPNFEILSNRSRFG
jgi:hypothetical protein